MVQNYPPEALPRYASYQQRSRQGSIQHMRQTTETPHRFQLTDQDCFSNPSLEDSHDETQVAKQFNQQLHERLRSCYGVESPPEQLFCIGINDGKVTIVVANGEVLPKSAARKIFNTSELRRFVASAPDSLMDESDGIDDLSYSQAFGNATGSSDGGRRSSVDWRYPENQGRKRQRARRPIDDDEELSATSMLSGIEIQNTDAVWEAYAQGFKNCQQTLCKLVAKAWVKAVEPKKQTAHPYTKNDEGAPDWWPKPWGQTKDEKVRHKEPDHLYKRERVHLLCHILRLVVEPRRRQHPDVQKTSLTIAKLREVTFETVSSFFAESESNASRERYLVNIFKIAKLEERYKKNELDGSTRVYPLKESKTQETAASDNEDCSFIKDEDGRHHAFSRTNPASHCIVSPSVGEANHHPSMASHHSVLGGLPMRSQFQPPSMSDTSSHSPSFADVTNVAVHGSHPVGDNGAALSLDMAPDPRESGRRPSAFSDYTSPGSGNMYSQQWSMGSSPHPSAAMYYTTSNGNPPPSSFDSQGGPLGASQSFVTHSFDNSTRPAFGHGGASMMRPVEMPQADLHPHQNFRMWPNDGREIDHS